MKALVFDISPARWALNKAASLMTRRPVVFAISPLRLRDRPIPELPNPEWVRLRTRLGGICGTDLGLVALRQHPATILQAFAEFPAVLGHENVSTIDAVGESVRRWQVGQRVCVEPAIGCPGRGIDPPCRPCAAGLFSLCEGTGDAAFGARPLIGLNRLTGGSWGEYFVAHQSQLFAVPDAVSDDAAVLIDPIASAAHAVLRRPPRDGETVLVNGAGIVALGIVATIRARGAKNPVTVMARHEFQAALARRLGATTVLPAPRGGGQARRYDEVARHVGGKRIAARFGNQALVGGFDLTYDCTGSGRGITDATKWTRSRGALVLVGTSGIALIDTTPIWFDELKIVGANGRQIECENGASRHTYNVVFDWIAAGALDLSVIPVTRYRLREYRRALSDLLTRRRHSVVKAAFDHTSSSFN
jgi:threonine dehydrogenase-like Zn-dependent dehydrogenase